MKLPNKGKYAYSDAPGAFRPRLTKTGIEGVSPVTIATAFSPKMIATGPTAGASTALLGATTGLAAGGLNIGSAKSSQGETQATTDRTGRALNTVGNVAKNIARFNPLSTIDALTNDRTDLDRQGPLTIAGREVKPYNIASDAAMIGGKVLRGDLSIGDVAEGVSDARAVATASPDKRVGTFFKRYDADDFMKSLDVAKESKIVQNQLEKEGFPSDFKKQIANTFEGLKQETSKMEQGKVHDRMLMRTRVDEINNLLANINQNPNLSTLSKIAGQFDPKTNPNADKMSTMDKIKAGFDPSSPNALALSATDRGIEGSAGNLLIGGKLSDIYKEGATNIPQGQIGLSSQDMFNIAKNTYENINTPGTLSAQRAGEIGRLVGDKGVTAGSLIKGLIPGRIGGSGSGNQSPSALQIRQGGAGFTPVQQQPIEQPLIPLLPTGQPQSGQDPTALADIAQQAYTSALGSYGIDPGFFARIRPRRFNTRPNSFRRSFIRNYF